MSMSQIQPPNAASTHLELFQHRWGRGQTRGRLDVTLSGRLCLHCGREIQPDVKLREGVGELVEQDGVQ
jgi:hypothetical protein